MSKFESHIRKYSVLGFSSLFIFACSGLSQAKDRDRDRNRDRGDHELRHSVDDRIEKGFAIAPVALDLNGKDRALVGFTAVTWLMRAVVTIVIPTLLMHLVAIPSWDNRKSSTRRFTRPAVARLARP